jgi:cobalt-zinc-cadmium efflux system protein
LEADDRTMAHSHDHAHVPADYNRIFAVGVGLNVAYVAVEAVFGLLVGSLALLADAGHNLSDVIGLLLAWGAAYLSTFPPTQRHTYGLRSSSILAALGNALILLVAVGGIAWEAIRRFWEPQPVTGMTLMWVAGVGVVINTLTALLFLKGRREDLNVKGAFLHMAADAGVSLGVVLAGLAILLTGRAWIDPAVSLLVALVIFLGTWGLLRDAFNLALHAVPAHVDLKEVREYLLALPGVDGVHDLHVWAMSTTETALTAHLIKPDARNDDELLARVCRELHDRFGIEHMTVQLERSSEANACRLAQPGAV